MEKTHFDAGRKTVPRITDETDQGLPITFAEWILQEIRIRIDQDSNQELRG